jgi:copper(I)-binding protein
MAGVISAPHDVDVIARDLGKLAQLKQLSTDTTRGQQQDDIALAISDPWIRSAPPGAGSMAGYLTIENKSADDYILIGAQSPLFAEVMLHGTSIEEDIASMSALGELTLKGGTQTQFQPMGKHLMLVEPERDFKSGDLVPLRLQLKNGSNIDAVFTVKDSQESD